LLSTSYAEPVFHDQLINNKQIADIVFGQPRYIQPSFYKENNAE